MSIRVSVVIATRDRREALLRCLAPVLADPATSEVIVVLDGGHDGSGEAVRDRFGHDPRVVLVETPGRGQEAAQQLGAERAEGDVVLFLDDDVELAEGVVSGHARHHEQGAVDVVVGYMPCALDGLGSEQWPVRHYAGQYERKIALYFEDPSAVLRHLWGGNVSFGREAWCLLPPYPGERPLLYHMDWELGLRCQWAGLRARFAPELRGVHHQRRDLEGFLRDRRRSAQARVDVHRVHRERLGPLTTEHFCQDASPWVRRVILSGSSGTAHAARAVCQVQLRVARATRSRRWERRSALDLTSLEGALLLADSRSTPASDARTSGLT